MGSNSLQRVPLTPFSRIIAAGSFQLETPLPEIDAYPPGRVSDLSAHLVNWTDDSAAIQLRWTAPGDELDSGIGIVLERMLRMPFTNVSFFSDAVRV